MADIEDGDADMEVVEDDDAIIDELELETDRLDYRIVDDQKEYERLLNQKGHTRQILSKYERARVIGIRAQQIQSGARPLIDVGKETDPIKIAMMELNQRVCPLQVKRPIPGRDPQKPNYEVYSVNQFNSYN